MAAKKALVTGITGQDGSYLAELLVSKGYEIHGLSRSQNPPSQAVCFNHRIDLDDGPAISRVIADVQPDECYHLAAETFIGAQSSDELRTFALNATGTQFVVAAVKEHAPACRLFVAGSCAMFGEVVVSPQTEDTPLNPRTMYGISKVAAYHLMRYYRSVYGIHASCGILYNHESPRRGKQFVTRKITAAAAAIKAGKQQKLCLGNLDTVRDWGHARDFARAMWLMLQNDEPCDYVIATGTGHTVREFVGASFDAVGLRWQDHVIFDPDHYRPAEPEPLVGSPRKAERVLGWTREYDFRSIVREMVDHDLLLTA